MSTQSKDRLSRAEIDRRKILVYGLPKGLGVAFLRRLFEDIDRVDQAWIQTRDRTQPRINHGGCRAAVVVLASAAGAQIALNRLDRYPIGEAGELRLRLASARGA